MLVALIWKTKFTRQRVILLIDPPPSNTPPIIIRATSQPYAMETRVLHKLHTLRLRIYTTFIFAENLTIHDGHDKKKGYVGYLCSSPLQSASSLSSPFYTVATISLLMVNPAPSPALLIFSPELQADMRGVLDTDSASPFSSTLFLQGVYSTE